ncbi:MAG: hypothetical protein V3T05_05965, partial [Myxococcota bacterium]
MLIGALALLGFVCDGIAKSPASLTSTDIEALGTQTRDWVAKRRKKRKAQGKRRGKKRKKGRTKAQEEATEAADALFDTTAPSGGGEAPPPPEPAADEGPDVLDLSTSAADTEAARKELLLGPGTDAEAKGGKGKKGKKKGEYDFGGGLDLDLGEEGFSFGGELADFGVDLDIASAERDRFDAALDMMSDEDFSAAAIEFRFFLEDPKFAEFKSEAEYQLAKAFYKIGFLEPALTRFKSILEQGPSHRRYRKSVEWLFFISRKMADETPVLAELARFRNVTFPKAYRNEYSYLLTKYLFIQAEAFELERLQQEQLMRGKASKAATIDFSAVSDALEEGGFDFSGGSDGGFDFSAAAGGGGGFDFGGGGSFDFGGGSGGAEEAIDEDAPVREEAPQTADEALRQGLDLITEVNKESKWYPRSKYLEGLLNYLGGHDQEAVNAFQEVVRVLNPREADRLDPKLREMAFLSLARIHYGYKQFNR